MSFWYVWPRWNCRTRKTLGCQPYQGSVARSRMGREECFARILRLWLVAVQTHCTVLDDDVPGCEYFWNLFWKVKRLRTIRNNKMSRR